jgi:hypothetical protein
VTQCEINLSEVEYLRGDTEIAFERLVDARHSPPICSYGSGLDAAEANLRFLHGEIERAARLAASSLDAALDRDDGQLAFSIQTLAGVAAASGRPREAARLLGFADNWFDKEHFSRDPSVHASRQLIMAKISEQLAAETIATIVTAGGAANEADIVREALAIELGIDGSPV